VADGNKTEKPTPRRRQKAREQGQIPRSRELMSDLATITAVLVIASQAPLFLHRWRALFERTLDTSAGRDSGNGIPLFAWSGYAALQGALLALSCAWGVALLSAVAQGGLVFVPEALSPKLERLSPGKRLEQFFSLPALGRVLKSLLPVAALMYLAVAVLRRDWLSILGLPHRNAWGMASFTLSRVFEIAWKSSLVLLVWAGVDYLLERQKLEGDLRMSREELMQEFKETEGNPATKGRIRRLQRQMRKRRMLEDVKRASVVITNPTEFAVALEYSPEMPAPTVVAKGRNLIARQIKEIARWHNIPLVENPPLAHALYRAIEVGQSIPPKLYAVVAGILAAIYRAQERARQAAPGGKGSEEKGRQWPTA
jgi:flagellar biosynthesis protein FlhB